MLFGLVERHALQQAVYNDPPFIVLKHREIQQIPQSGLSNPVSTKTIHALLAHNRLSPIVTLRAPSHHLTIFALSAPKEKHNLPHPRAPERG